jgi:amphi-Trp domain-containing protein
MSDVKVERKESVSRDEAASWLLLLSEAFIAGGHGEFPFGPGTLSLHIPDRVRAELEVEVEGNEVEVELEFKWTTAKHEASPADSGADRVVRARQDNGARRATRSPRSRATRTGAEHARSASAGQTRSTRGSG